MARPELPPNNATALEMVTAVIRQHHLSKTFGRKLEAMPPDEMATNYLVRAYKNGKVEAWLAAYLLGCLRHRNGYDTAKEILRSSSGQSANSYAGIAMAKIGSDSALDDLRESLLHGEYPKTRQGAAYGLAELGDAAAVPALVEVYERQRLPARLAVSAIAKCRPDDSELIAILSHHDERLQRLGCGIVQLLLENSLSPKPGRTVATVVHSLLLDSENPPVHRDRFESLFNWVSTMQG